MASTGARQGLLVSSPIPRTSGAQERSRRIMSPIAFIIRPFNYRHHCHSAAYRAAVPGSQLALVAAIADGPNARNRGCHSRRKLTGYLWCLPKRVDVHSLLNTVGLPTNHRL